MDLNIQELETILYWADIVEANNVELDMKLWLKLKQELNEQESY